MRMHDLLQAGRFVVVGGASYVLNLTTYAIFLSVDIPYIAAAALSFVIGFFFNFAANRWWTFNAAGVGSANRQLVRFTVVAAIVLVLDLGLLRLTVEVLGLHPFLGQAIVIAFLAPLSFGLNRMWTFRALSHEAVPNGS
jgi:putative flippase GtrA